MSDAGPPDAIWFDEERRPYVDLYLKQEGSRNLSAVLDRTSQRIDGFETPLGMELLSTVDWLIQREGCGRTVIEIRAGLKNWPAGREAGERKLKLFDDRLIALALNRLEPTPAKLVLD